MWLTRAFAAQFLNMFTLNDEGWYKNETSNQPDTKDDTSSHPFVEKLAENNRMSDREISEYQIDQKNRPME